MTDDKLTMMLGWASAGLGTSLLLAPAPAARALGIEDSPEQRAVVAGVELVAAAGLLGQGSPMRLWARVAGDLMDLALLGQSARDRGLTPRVLKTALKQDLTGGFAGGRAEYARCRSPTSTR